MCARGDNDGLGEGVIVGANLLQRHIFPKYISDAYLFGAPLVPFFITPLPLCVEAHDTLLFHFLWPQVPNF